MTNVAVDLATSLVQTFAIVFLGYLFGRAELVTKTHADGIGIFISFLSLPALLFRSMAILDFGTIHWTFLWGILISKSLVFVCAIVGTLLLDHKNSLGNAGLRAIFVTQSNDFALGLPIIESVFKSVHPTYIDMIYLVAPISLILLNPIGFFLLSNSTGAGGHQTMTQRVLAIGKQLISNPLVFMSFLGIITNFATDHSLPSILDDFLLMLGNAYSPAALFLLGHTIVGKMKGLKPQAMVIPSVLSITKVLILPIIAYQTIGLLGGLCDLKVFGFIYASIPTTPSVLLYAQQYGVNIKHTTIGMVLCTIIGAPMMLIGAQVANMTSDSSYDDFAETEMIALAVPSAIGATWVCFLFWCSDLFPGRKYHCLFWAVLCQSFTSIASLGCGLTKAPGYELVRLFIVSTTQFAAYSWITCACMETACRVLVLDCTVATHRVPVTSVDLDEGTLASSQKPYSTSVSLLSRWASVPHATRLRVYHVVSWLGSALLVLAGVFEWALLPQDDTCFFEYRSTQHAIALAVSAVSGSLIVMSLSALKWTPDRSKIFRGTLVSAANPPFKQYPDMMVADQSPLLANVQMTSDGYVLYDEAVDPAAPDEEDEEHDMESTEIATSDGTEFDSHLDVSIQNAQLLEAARLGVAGSVKLGSRSGYRLLAMALYQLATFIVLGAMDLLTLFYVGTHQNRSEGGILLFLCVAMVSFQGVLTFFLYGFSFNRAARKRFQRWKQLLTDRFTCA